jgi:hypothetical protein
MARYSKKSQDTVEEAMHKEKRGKLRSGRSGKKVTSRKQAIAIGLSEAREKGAKVPPPPKKSANAKKASGKKAAPKKKAAAKKASPKKKAGTTRKGATRKKAAAKKGTRKAAGRKRTTRKKAAAHA